MTRVLRQDSRWLGVVVMASAVLVLNTRAFFQSKVQERSLGGFHLLDSPGMEMPRHGNAWNNRPAGAID